MRKTSRGSEYLNSSKRPISGGFTSSFFFSASFLSESELDKESSPWFFPEKSAPKMSFCIYLLGVELRFDLILTSVTHSLILSLEEFIYNVDLFDVKKI